MAVRDPALVREAARLFPGKVAVGIDARGGKVAVEGWAEMSELTAIELGQRFEGAGVAAIIYTDIDRDGVLKGINWPSTLELAKAVSIPVIASVGWPRWTISAPWCSRNTASSKAPFRVVRSMTGGLTSREAMALIKGARGA